MYRAIDTTRGKRQNVSDVFSVIPSSECSCLISWHTHKTGRGGGHGGFGLGGSMVGENR